MEKECERHIPKVSTKIPQFKQKQKETVVGQLKESHRKYQGAKDHCLPLQNLTIGKADKPLRIFQLSRSHIELNA